VTSAAIGEAVVKGNVMTFPLDRPLSEDEARAWMRQWLEARAVGWEAYGLGHALIAMHGEPDAMRHTLFLEAALAHIRCLIEFLIGRPHPKSGKRRWKSDLDVTPLSLLPTWSPEEALRASWPLLTQSLDRIDKALAHVSQERVAIVRTTWELAPLADAVLTGLDLFIAFLEADDRDFSARCLGAWVGLARQHLTEKGVSLNSPIDVVPSSSLLFVAPIGESVGRAAALMQRAEQQSR
jgi:hypothetical protein